MIKNYKYTFHLNIPSGASAVAALLTGKLDVTNLHVGVSSLAVMWGISASVLCLWERVNVVCIFLAKSSWNDHIKPSRGNHRPVALLDTGELTGIEHDLVHRDRA
jgi:hypothetical protein